MKKLQKLASLFMAAALSLTSAAALADIIAPDDSDYDDLAGVTVNATVGEYHEADNTFTVTLYADDVYEIDDIDELKKGDIVLAGGQVFEVGDKSVDEFGETLVKCTNGWEIIFSQVGDDKMIAMNNEDERRFMHVFAQLQLPVAGGITFEDASNPDEKPVTYTGLQEILKIKQEKETNSIGLDFYATVITMNKKMEIVRIYQEFDVAQ